MTKTKQLYLTVDNDLCRNCGTCSRLLPDFKRKFRGKLPVSSHRYKTDQETYFSIRSVIEACQVEAIFIG